MYISVRKLLLTNNFMYFQIVDPDMKLLNINARWPGARNDSFIWTNSPIRRAVQFHYDMGERRTWLIGKWLRLHRNRFEVCYKWTYIF